MPDLDHIIIGAVAFSLGFTAGLVAHWLAVVRDHLPV